MFKNETQAFLSTLVRFGWRPGLENITAVLAHLGDPHRRFPSVHIAGTNGKGSTAAMLESIFRHAGYKTGLYTSPHLRSLTERILVNHRPIGWKRLHGYLQAMRHKIEELEVTYFEALTAAAMQFFADEDIDLAFLEVGLGGRLDATNVVTPVLSMITSIDLDHTQHLGRTLSEIAAEKAGIVKPGIPFLASCKHSELVPVFEGIGRERGSPFYNVRSRVAVEPLTLDETGSRFNLRLPETTYADLWVGLAGAHQIENAGIAVAAVQLLKSQGYAVEEFDVREGLRHVVWPGRLQRIQVRPKVVLDVAHNPTAIESLVHALKSFFTYERLIVIVGILKDKDFRGMAGPLAQAATELIAVTPQSDRALAARELAREVEHTGVRCREAVDMAEAWRMARGLAHPADLICVTGSHYTVGDFLKIYKNS